MASTSREELSAIDQALQSIQSRMRDIKQTEENLTLGEKFRKAAEQASNAFQTGRVGAFKSAIKEAGETVSQFTRQIKEARLSTVAMSGAFLGFIGGFGLAKTTLMAFGGLIKSVFNVGRSVVGAFTRTIGALFSFFYGALKSSGGGTGLFEQLQEMRKAFGGLEDYTNQAIFGIVDNLRALPRRLEITGYWFTKLIENARKYAETLGPLFMDFARYQFTPATALLLHGMGATEEQQVDLVRSSRAMGTSLNDMMIGIARNGSAVGQAIGESAKVIQKEMLSARENIEVFGAVTDEELGLAIGRLRTLGMEAKDVVNIFSTFDTFQGAAEAASQLAAAFGMQLDVFQMVNEENPASRLDMLRQQLFRTGRSAEQLSRRELMLFANVLGESDHRLVQMALSAQNAGMSMEDIAKAAEESGEKTKPLEEVLSDLANQIARLIHQGGGYDTFLAAMNYGIERGIKHWMWLNQLTFSYRMALHRTAWGFRNLAMVFMQYFPGIRDITKGFVEILDPSRIREFFRVLTGHTFDYLDASGGHDGLVYQFLRADNFDPRGFIEGLVESIMDWTNPTGAAIRRIITGLKNVGSAVLIGVQQLLEFASEKLFGDPRDGLAARMIEGFRDALRFLVGFMTPGNVESSLMQAGDFAGGFFRGFINPIIEFFKNPEVQNVLKEIVELLGDAFVRVIQMTDHVWKKITGAISTALLGGFLTDENGLGPGMAATLSAMLVAPGIISAILAMSTKGLLHLGGGIASVVGRGFRSVIGKSLDFSTISSSLDFSDVLGGRRNATRTASSAAGNMTEVINSSGGIGRAAQRASRLDPGLIGRGGLALAAVAALIGVVGFALVKSLNSIEIQPGLMEKAGAFGLLLTSMIAPIIAAVAVGAVMATGYGAGFLALGAIGIAGFIGIMAVITNGFLRSLNDLAITNNTLSILGILPSFFSSIGSVAVAVSGAALSSIRPGAMDNAGRILDKTTEFMTSASSKVIELANSVKYIFANASSSEISKIETGFEIFMSLFSTITSIVPGISSLIDSSKAGFLRGQRARNESITIILNEVTDLLDSLFGENSTLTRLISYARGISITSEDAEKIRVLEPLFDLMTSVTQISTEYGGKLIDATRGGRRVSISPSEIALINTGVLSISGAVTSMFTNGVPSAIRAVINAVRGQDLPEGSADIVSGVSSILNAVLGFVEPLSGALMSERGRATLEAISNGELNRQGRKALENLSDNAPALGSMATSISSIITEVKEPISQLIGIVVSQASNIGNVEEFADKAAAILDIISSISQIIDLSQQLGEMSENNLRITTDGIGDFNSSNMENIVNVIGRTVGYFADNSQLNRIGIATAKLDELNSEFMPKLREFFEESGDVVRAIESSGVVRLEQSLQAGLRELLPAAVAAIETTGAEITTDNISVALGGNTFNINVILEVDGQKLAEVAAENLTGNRT